jgi:ATP-dependent exoDNAse (exonuclease V) alpha subunit
VLVEGSRVYATQNDPMCRYANGSLGTVIQLPQPGCGGALVLFSGSQHRTRVYPATWTERRHAWSQKTGRVEPIVAGRVSALLLLLHGYAATIHKAQGMSLDDVRIDLTSRVFEVGQTYVALGRARSLDGLSLASPLRPEDIQVDRAALSYVRGRPAILDEILRAPLPA